jgi:hypothetical protein
MTAYVLSPDEQDRRKVNTAINQLAQGRSNAAGTVTLAASQGSTAVTAQNCGTGSVVMLSPLTAHAAAEIGNGTVWVSAVAKGSFTLTHANNAQNDRTFGWVALG